MKVKKKYQTNFWHCAKKIKPQAKKRFLIKRIWMNLWINELWMDNVQKLIWNWLFALR